MFPSIILRRGEQSISRGGGKAFAPSTLGEWAPLVLDIKHVENGEQILQLVREETHICNFILAIYHQKRQI